VAAPVAAPAAAPVQNLESGANYIGTGTKDYPGSQLPPGFKDAPAKPQPMVVASAGPDYKTIAMLGGLLLVLMWLTKRR
jgi:hypothetical protein